MTDRERIRVEVAYATPDRQIIVELEVEAGCRVDQAIAQSAIAEHFPGADLSQAAVGIFSRKTQREDILRDGDRIEIYRPLVADPKEVRREMAEHKRAEAAARKRRT